MANYNFFKVKRAKAFLIKIFVETGKLYLAFGKFAEREIEIDRER